MRVYLKSKPIATKLMKFAKNNDADYVEDKFAVWKMSKQCGESQLAIAIDNDGLFKIGTIVKSCDNFQPGTIGRFFPEEAEWLIKVLPLVAKFNLMKGGKK